MRLVVNGEPRDLPPGTTVAQLVAEVAPSPRGIAVAIDRELLPRSAWAARALRAGEQVEIVTAAAGG